MERTLQPQGKGDVRDGAGGGTQGTYSQELYTNDPTTGNLANKAGVTYSYAAQASGCQGTPATHPIAHAVSAAGGNTYGYDCNGNMTQRVIGTVSYTLEYDAENRLTTVKQGSSILATFLYDGDGKRVRGDLNGVTTTYIGELAEWSNSVMTRYYYAGLERVGMNRGGTLYFLLDDHLGSASIVATSGGQYSKVLFKPWGSDRYTSGTAPTTYRYTGQRVEAGIGLYFYGARWYDSELGRFVQPDSIIPEQSQGVQAWDRYAYVNNNPVRYNDPTGHRVDDGCSSEGCNATKAEINYDRQRYNSQNCNSGVGGGCPNYLEAIAFGVTGLVVAASVGPFIDAVGGTAAGWVTRVLPVACAYGNCTDKLDTAKEVIQRNGNSSSNDIDQLVAIAKETYPKLADKVQLHPPIPLYLGGDPNQELVPLNAAYHQFITNAFRALWAYNQQALPSPEKLTEMINYVYNLFPLP